MIVADARGQMERAASALEALGVSTLPLPTDAALRFALLRAETNLKLPDCCVLLAAEHHGGSIATCDRRLGAVASERGLQLARTPSSERRAAAGRPDWAEESRQALRPMPDAPECLCLD